MLIESINKPFDDENPTLSLTLETARIPFPRFT